MFLYGKEEIKKVKVFKALYKPAGCMVQVFVVRENKDRFRAFTCTDLTASAVEIMKPFPTAWRISTETGTTFRLPAC